MPRIILSELTKKFGNVTAVDYLNLEIPDGSFTTLLDPSGCGKTIAHDRRARTSDIR